MSKKLFKVVCTREEVIYVAADSHEEAEHWATRNHGVWEEDVLSCDTWDAQAFDAPPELSDGWTPGSLCYGNHCSPNPKRNRDVSCIEVLNGRIE